MQESHTPITSPADTSRAPLHDDIAQCARDLWVQYGRPADRDVAIWLEAEQRLLSATQASPENNSGPASWLGLPPAQPARASDRPTIQEAGAPAVRAAF